MKIGKVNKKVIKIVRIAIMVKYMLYNFIFEISNDIT